jgi:hypothetical protein
VVGYLAMAKSLASLACTSSNRSLFFFLVQKVHSTTLFIIKQKHLQIETNNGIKLHASELLEILLNSEILKNLKSCNSAENFKTNSVPHEHLIK